MCNENKIVKIQQFNLGLILLCANLVLSLLLLLILRGSIFFLFLNISDLHFDMSCSCQLRSTHITRICLPKTWSLTRQCLATRSCLIFANYICWDVSVKLRYRFFRFLVFLVSWFWLLLIFVSGLNLTSFARLLSFLSKVGFTLELLLLLAVLLQGVCHCHEAQVKFDQHVVRCASTLPSFVH